MREFELNKKLGYIWETAEFLQIRLIAKKN